MTHRSFDIRLDRSDAVGTARRQTPRSGRRPGLIVNSLAFGFTAATFVGAMAMGTLVFYASQLPDSGTWAVPARPANIRVLAADGQLISNRGAMGGETVSLSALPAYVGQAVLAIEDKRFYSHFGIDPIGLAAAAVGNVRAQRVERGGSTLTQQLAKNLFLSPEQTFARKAQEALLALWLERLYSKDEILEMYLNRVYFGAGAHGIEAASQTYFGKPAVQLSIGEAALLAGLVKAPSRLNPKTNPEGANARAALVLAEMVREGFIAENAALTANNAVAVPRSAGSGNYIADWVETLIEAYVGELPSDAVVHTSIDWRLQQLAEQSIRDAVNGNGGARHFSQGALVSITPDGVVKALVGGVDYSASQYNRAVTARRQPGSTFKTFVYLAALEKGYSPNTVADDAPFDFHGWSPRNASRRYSGPVTLRDAFTRSLNTIAARLAIDVTPRVVAETAMRLGISSRMDEVPSIALGTSEVSLLELTTAYAPFANGGIGTIANVIERIETSDGEVLYENPSIGPGQVIAPSIAATMNDMLQTSWRQTSKRAPQIAGLPVGGKTGTSQQGRDALFVGYTPQLVTGVWLGNDDDGATNLSGGNVPLDAWYAFMLGAH